MSVGYSTERTKTFQASAALAAWRRVRLDGDGKLAYASDSSTDCIGSTDAPILAANDYASVVARTAQGTVILTASATESIAAGDAVYAAANGKIAKTGTVLVGEALTGAEVDGDLLEVMLSPAAILGDIARSALTEDALAEYVIPHNHVGVNATLALLGASAGTPSGAFGLTPGTHGSASPIIVGEAANNNSKTNTLRFLFALPPEYVSGGDIKVRAHATITGDVAVSQTIDVQAFKSDDEAGVGSDLCATAAQTLTEITFDDYDFTITPTGLAAGDVLDIEITGVANDTGGSANKLIQIGKISVLCDIKG